MSYEYGSESKRLELPNPYRLHNRLLWLRGPAPPLGAENRFSLVGTSAILAFVAAFCFQASARLRGRFNVESVLVWVEMAGSWQTSRIDTGNNFSSRMNTENHVVRTEAMTLRVWRARIESVVFGKDDARQVTAMFSTEQEAKAPAEQLVQFARSQSVLVAPAPSRQRYCTACDSEAQPGAKFCANCAARLPQGCLRPTT